MMFKARQLYSYVAEIVIFRWTMFVKGGVLTLNVNINPSSSSSLYILWNQGTSQLRALLESGSLLLNIYRELEDQGLPTFQSTPPEKAWLDPKPYLKHQTIPEVWIPGCLGKCQWPNTNPGKWTDISPLLDFSKIRGPISRKGTPEAPMFDRSRL